MSKEEEWAIRDEATGEWWDGEKWGTAWWVFASYPIAMNSGMKQMQAFSFGIPGTVRIVPAPPREMSDAEAEAWFVAQDQGWTIWPTKYDSNRVGVMNGRGGVTYGKTIYDAIRAARRKLEGK